jgi:type VI protein secretion system component VasA
MLWTGMFTLKNDSVSVSMSFVCGNQDIAKSCLNQMSIELTSTNTSLKILQRMRLEQSQLEGVKKKLQVN